MQVRLQLVKEGATLYAGEHEIADAADFGQAFAQVWSAIHARHIGEASSIGALMDAIGDDVLNLVSGATIVISPPRAKS